MSAQPDPHYRIGLVGAGNSAHALACYLRQQGHQISIYARQPQALAHLQEYPRIRSRGAIQGEFEVHWCGHNPKALAHCEILFLCTTADAYPDVVQQLAPIVHAGQKIVLFSSKFGGSQEVSECLRSQGIRNIPVVETDSLFACRLQADHSIWVRGFKRWNLFCAPRRSQTEACHPWMTRLFPGLEAAQNLLQRGLTDFGALAHALTVLLNANSIDRQQSFLFYYEGYTERTVVLLEQLEREFQALATAYGTSLLPASQLLHRYYGCETRTLLEAMRSVPNYRHSLAPGDLNTRYLSEDVACTLVPAQQLSQRAELETPVLDSVVSMASVLHGVDYRRQGRTLEKLGWGDFGPREIREWMAW